MLSLPHAVRIYVCDQATDMRRGRYKLAGMVKQVMKKDPVSGELFAFFNKSRTAIKILFFDHGGYVVIHKVLEQGTYSRPAINGGSLSGAELSCVLEGIEILKKRKKKRFQPV